ncbi:MAG: PP2C family protein-serine/threonine phosphatase [Deltaproteobacteria bacterium]|nr:MAG: PP2C family protein-serine/threonine phosphatase [Deltaproteobacteria bacterium]
MKKLYIEEHLLPESTPKIPGLYFDSYYQSAQEVGGDYFDFIEIDERYLGIVVADVSGKGLESSMLMSIVCHALRSQAGLSLSPREVIDETEGLLLPKLGQNHFVTLFYAILDRKKMTLKCSNAGHPPLLVGNRITGKTHWVRPKGVALGLSRFQRITVREECEVSLNPGDFLFFYTDGVTEARNSDDDCFGRKRLETFFSETSREKIQIIHELKTELENFAEGAPQQDDVTAVYLERCA